ncbi:hypothetical protein BDW22DRAFT_1361923 [Trametopsis cervina]|nr:hypothetical protein BDW22DRAFT_1361923 [Trametopsis cervina]
MHDRIQAQLVFDMHGTVPRRIAKNPPIVDMNHPFPLDPTVDLACVDTEELFTTSRGFLMSAETAGRCFSEKDVKTICAWTRQGGRPCWRRLSENRVRGGHATCCPL